MNYRLPPCSSTAAAAAISGAGFRPLYSTFQRRSGGLTPIATIRCSARSTAAENETYKGISSSSSSHKSFYELLGINREGKMTGEEIKRAYKRMARKYHPDVCRSPERAEEYTRRFIEVQQAYETLSDPNTRALYDRHLARGLHLAFDRRRFQQQQQFDYQQDLEKRSAWKSHWQDQLAELTRRSARMRGQQAQSQTKSL